MSRRMSTLYLLYVNRNTGVYHHPIQALNHVLVIAVDKSHPETCQTKVLTHAPHEMGSLWIRNLRGMKQKIFHLV